jgi:hypothetical protein
MYEEFYGLKAKPFSIVPDPEFLYRGRPTRHGLCNALIRCRRPRWLHGFLRLAREADIVRRHIVQEVLDDKRKFGVFAVCPTAEPELS